jgi:hypothetical protein
MKRFGTVITKERSQSISPVPSVWYTHVQLVPCTQLDTDVEHAVQKGGEGGINAVILKNLMQRKPM